MFFIITVWLQVCAPPCVPPPSIAPQLGSPSEVAAAGTPYHKGEQEHHSSDDQHKVEHTPLCKGGWVEERHGQQAVVGGQACINRG